MAKPRQRVLIVDDDPGFSTLVRTLLERAGLAVECAVDGEEALAKVSVAEPQLVLLDVCLPGSSGYEVYRELKDRCGESLPVIFVSGERVDAYDRIAGLMLGADDYLVKPFHPDELVARMRRSLAHRGNGETDAGSDGEDLLGALTPRERQVLALLAAGLSSKHAARELVISPRTLGTHVQHILTKLGVHNRAQAVAIALRAGLTSDARDGRAALPPLV